MKKGDIKISFKDNELIYYSFKSKELKSINIKSRKRETLTGLTNPERNGLGQSRIKKSGDWIVWVEEEVMKSMGPESSYWELNAYNTLTKELIKIDKQNEESKNMLNSFDVYNNKIVYSIDGRVVKNTNTIVNITEAIINIYDLESEQNNQIDYEDYGINCIEISNISICDNKFAYSGKEDFENGNIENRFVAIYNIDTKESKPILEQKDLSQIFLKDNIIYGFKNAQNIDADGMNKVVDFIKYDIDNSVETILIKERQIFRVLGTNVLDIDEERNIISINIGMGMAYDIESGKIAEF